LVDVAGVPLALELMGTTVHDVKRIQEVLEGVVVEGPEWAGIAWEHLCVEKGYFREPARENIVLRGYIPQVVGGGEEKAGVERDRGKQAWRRVVERIILMAQPIQETAGEVREEGR
jgi:hypothetical protein